MGESAISTYWRVHQEGFGFAVLRPMSKLFGDIEPSNIWLEIYRSSGKMECKLHMYAALPEIDHEPRAYEIIIPYDGPVQFLEKDIPILDADKVAWLVLIAMRITLGFPGSKQQNPIVKQTSITIIHRIWLKAVTALLTREDVSRKARKKKKRQTAAKPH